MNKQYLWTAAALTAGVLATTQTFAQVTLNVTDNTVVTACFQNRKKPTNLNQANM